MPQFYTLDDVDVQGKRVLLRLDLNVPMKEGRVQEPMRLEKALVTVKELRRRGASVLILSHLGRPNGQRDVALSLRPVAQELSKLLGEEVEFLAQDPAQGAQIGALAMLENVRFDPGEESNDPALAARWGALGDLFVNDAFSVSHRAHASVEAITRVRPAFAGRQLQTEVQYLSQVMHNPRPPVAAIVGGSKISTKIHVLENLMHKVAVLAPVGGLANTFLKAQGHSVGRSLVENDHLETARRIMMAAAAAGCHLLLPTQVVVAPSLSEYDSVAVCAVDAVPDTAMILDMGPASVRVLCDAVQGCATALWNGPLGVCEVPPFDAGSLQFARFLADRPQLFCVAGGGETVMVLRAAGALDRLSYVSTAGGAFLEYMEGKTLPGLAALQPR